jgi:hypothetical protein
MIPIEFPQANQVFKKPDNMTDEECYELHTFHGLVDGPNLGTISCWQLSKEDIEEIQRTGVIWLRVLGARLPPMAVFTENPFE